MKKRNLSLSLNLRFDGVSFAGTMLPANASVIVQQSQEQQGQESSFFE